MKSDAAGYFSLLKNDKLNTGWDEDEKTEYKSCRETLPFLALSLFLVFLLSWTFVPYTRENVARHDFTGYTAGIKNNALQQEYPDDFFTSCLAAHG